MVDFDISFWKDIPSGDTWGEPADTMRLTFNERKTRFQVECEVARIVAALQYRPVWFKVRAVR